MRREYCLDIADNVHKLGDLNLFLQNTETISYPPVDRTSPGRPFFTGIIHREVTVGDRRRRFLFYLPKRFPISGAGLFLFPDDGVDTEQFLTSGGWKTIAEERNVALIILEAGAGGWSRQEIQKEVDYGEAVFKDAISRVNFSLNESTYYILGFGAGAYPAVTCGLLNSTLYSCIVADGGYQLDDRLLEQLSSIRSDRDPSKSKLEVAMPAWLLSHTSDEGDAVLNCLKAACCVEDRGLSNPYASVFQQNLKTYQNSRDGLPMAEVWFTGKSLRAEIPEESIHRQMVSFALRFKRWPGIGNGEFRPARTYQDMGLKRFEAVLGGRKREWYVYEPSTYRNNSQNKLPVVLAIHGYSCTGELFAENSEWHVTAEKRGFFVVYMSAFPSNLHTGNRTVPLPTWNAVAMTAETDDIGYVAAVMRDVKSRYPVDNERVYVSGHSNGSLFTQKLMQETPLEYAAFAPQGAQYHLNLSGGSENRSGDRIPRDGVLRPVWLMMGHEDIGDRDSLESGSANRKFISMMCDVNSLDESKGQYLENGKYHTYTYLNQDHIPLLRFTGVQDLPHAYTPEMAEMFWNQFFCHFRRKADGSIIYTA